MVNGFVTLLTETANEDPAATILLIYIYICVDVLTEHEEEIPDKVHVESETEIAISDGNIIRINDEDMRRFFIVN